jgi:ADP-ribosylglycohydrolase
MSQLKFVFLFSIITFSGALASQLTGDVLTPEDVLGRMAIMDKRDAAAKTNDELLTLDQLNADLKRQQGQSNVKQQEEIDLASFTLPVEGKETYLKEVRKRIVYSFLFAAYLDALGRPVESTSDLASLKRGHPNGVIGFDSFTDKDRYLDRNDYKLSCLPPPEFMSADRKKKLFFTTDDTGWAKILARHITACPDGTIDLKSFVESLLQNDKTPHGWTALYRCPGETMGCVLDAFHAYTNWRDKFEEILSGDVKLIGRSYTGEFPIDLTWNAGNGAIMGSYPCALRWWYDSKKAQEQLVAQCSPFCQHVWVKAANAAIGAGIEAALRGAHEQEVVNVMKAAADGYNKDKSVPDRTGELKKFPLTSERIQLAYEGALAIRDLLEKENIKTPEELMAALYNKDSELSKKHFEITQQFVGLRGTAYDTIAAAVYGAFACPQNPYLGALLITNSPVDSDTAGSVAGPLIIALYGKKAIPKKIWKEEVTRIEGYAEIEQLADTIASQSMEGYEAYQKENNEADQDGDKIKKGPLPGWTRIEKAGYVFGGNGPSEVYYFEYNCKLGTVIRCGIDGSYWKFQDESLKRDDAADGNFSAGPEIFENYCTNLESLKMILKTMIEIQGAGRGFEDLKFLPVDKANVIEWTQVERYEMSITKNNEVLFLNCDEKADKSTLSTVTFNGFTGAFECCKPDGSIVEYVKEKWAGLGGFKDKISLKMLPSTFDTDCVHPKKLKKILEIAIMTGTLFEEADGTFEKYFPLLTEEKKIAWIAKTPSTPLSKSFLFKVGAACIFVPLTLFALKYLFEFLKMKRFA